MRFFVGLHQPSDARHFPAAFISVNRLRSRKSPFTAMDWIMDSGAFTEIATYGHYRHGVEKYAAEIRRWSRGSGRLLSAVAQDFMCEPWIIERTGLSVEQHQRMTVERYDALCAQDTGDVYLMPVLQGYRPEEYVGHLRMYGERIGHGAWIGVGSVCKRNRDVDAVIAVLWAIKRARADVRLHGFGLKKTALANASVIEMLETADSMAWSFQARKNGRNANSWREADRWINELYDMPIQLCFPIGCFPPPKQ